MSDPVVSRSPPLPVSSSAGKTEPIEHRLAPRVDSRSTRKLVVQSLLLLVTVGLVAWVIAVNRTWLVEIARRGPRWGLVTMAVGLLVVESFNLTVRWRILLDAVGVRLPFGRIYRMVAGAIVASLVMPGANGGDALKIALVATATPDRAKAIATLLLDRIIGLCGLLLVVVLAGTISWGTAPDGVRTLTLVAGGLAGLGLLGLAWLQSRWPLPLAPLGARLPWGLDRLAAQLGEGRSSLRARPLAVPLALLLATCGQMLNICAFYLMTRAFRIDGGTLASFFVLVPFALLSTAVPLPLGALGVAEGFSDQLFAWCGIAGGGLGMIGYRFAYTVSIPVLLAILLAQGGAAALPWRKAVQADDSTS